MEFTHFIAFMFETVVVMVRMNELLYKYNVDSCESDLTVCDGFLAKSFHVFRSAEQHDAANPACRVSLPTYMLLLF